MLAITAEIYAAAQPSRASLGGDSVAGQCRLVVLSALFILSGVNGT
jgi:hypothetical protein